MAPIDPILDELRRIRREGPKPLDGPLTRLIDALGEIGKRQDVPLARRDTLQHLAGQLAQMAERADVPVVAVALAGIQADIQALPDELFVRSPDGGGASGSGPPGASDDLAEPASIEPLVQSRWGGPWHWPTLGLGLIATAVITVAAYGWSARHVAAAERPWLPPVLALSVALAGCLGSLALGRLRQSRPVMLLLAALVLVGGMADVLLLREGPLQVPTQSTGQTGSFDSGTTGPDLATNGHDRLPFWSIGGAPDAIAPPRGHGDPTASDEDAGPEPTAATDEPDQAQGNQVDPEIQRQARRPRPLRTQRPQERFAHLLERKVVLVEVSGEVHKGVLTGLDRDGVTLLTEIQIFGNPIMADRNYLYEHIAELYARDLGTSGAGAAD